MFEAPRGRVQKSGDEVSRDAVDIVAARDPRNHCDAISKPTVLLQFVAVDRRQLRLVRKVEDSDLRIEVENGRDFGVIEIEVDEQRSRPRSQHRSRARWRQRSHRRHAPRRRQWLSSRCSARGDRLLDVARLHGRQNNPAMVRVPDDLREQLGRNPELGRPLSHLKDTNVLHIDDIDGRAVGCRSADQQDTWLPGARSAGMMRLAAPPSPSRQSSVVPPLQRGSGHPPARPSRRPGRRSATDRSREATSPEHLGPESG